VSLLTEWFQLRFTEELSQRHFKQPRLKYKPVTQFSMQQGLFDGNEYSSTKENEKMLSSRISKLLSVAASRDVEIFHAFRPWLTFSVTLGDIINLADLEAYPPQTDNQTPALWLRSDLVDAALNIVQSLYNVRCHDMGMEPACAVLNTHEVQQLQGLKDMLAKAAANTVPAEKMFYVAEKFMRPTFRSATLGDGSKQLFEYESILTVVHLPGHWIALKLSREREHVFSAIIFDSLPEQSKSNFEDLKFFITLLAVQVYATEHGCDRAFEMMPSIANDIRVVMGRCQRQHNAVDCGYWALHNVACELELAEVSSQYKNAKHCRRALALGLLLCMTILSYGYNMHEKEHGKGLTFDMNFAL